MSKILVAEDDKFMGSAYRLKLTKEGYDVKVVESGVELMNSLDSYLPDLIILDLIMPNKDGFEVLKDIKSDKKYASIPVVVVSNLGQKEDRDLAAKLGADMYMAKTDPGYRLEDLTSKIKEMVKK